MGPPLPKVEAAAWGVVSSRSPGRLRAGGAALLLGCAVAGGARTAAQPAPPSIGVSVEVVQVDVVVTEASGTRVADLGIGDFLLRVKGVSVPISHVAYVAGAASGPGAIGAGAVRPTVPGSGGAGAGAFVVVVDEPGLSPKSLPYVRDALRAWARRLDPQDRVGLLRVGQPARAPLAALLGDRARLAEAIASISARADRRVSATEERPTLPVGLDDGAGSPEAGLAALDLEWDRRLAAGSYSTLAFALNGLGPLPGRKHLLLVTDALPGLPGGLVELANRVRVVIHTLDPRGPVVTFPVRGNATTQAELVSQVEARNAALRREHDVLEQLAEATGGLAVHGTNDLVGALERVSADRQGYYLLGFTPDSSREPAPQGRRRQEVEIRVRRKGLEVRARSSAYPADIGAP